jgi:hypothetical protein
MSYDDLLPWRALAQRIPKDVLNPTHRLIIVTLMTYESEDKGAFFKPENIANELGLSYRAVMDNFHYLGSGQVWKDGQRKPCENLECKSHLGIIKTAYYAKRSKAQNYRLDQKAIKDLVSVHLSAPINESMNLVAEMRAPEDLMRAPEDANGCDVPQAYKHNKQLININKRISKVNETRFNDLILNNLPKELRSKVTAGQNYEEQLDELERLRVSENRIREAYNLLPWHEVKSVGGAVSKLLADLVTEATKVMNERERLAEQNRLMAEQNAERERLKAPLEIVELRANEAREAIRRGTP